MASKSGGDADVTDIDEYMEQLSSDSPVPGGGSVAALECAMGASLLAMVANLTAGRKKYASVQDRIADIRDEALALRARASALAVEDTEAYARVSRVLTMPKDTERQRVERSEHMQAALKGAVEPPLQTMKVASRILDLAAELALIGNTSAISDVGTAVGAIRAGFDGAFLNVEINLASIKDAAWVAGIRTTVNNVSPVEERAQEITRHVLSVIRS